MAIPVLVAVAALSAYIVVATPIALSFALGKKCEASVAGAPFSPSRFDAEKSTITVRGVLAVATAGLLSVVFRAPHGYWMAMVAGAVLQSTHVSQLSAAFCTPLAEDHSL